MSFAWLPPARLAERRAAAAGPLAPLARSLAADLEPVLARPVAIPREKARLSRAGGRCPRDGTLLTFDPASPRRHRCPACGDVQEGEAHDRYWLVGYHLWLAERAVHAAALHALAGDARHRAFAATVLDAYADAYLAWPNVDNVLGPTRPFFSTYLESIWLLQLCVALELLEGAAHDTALGGRVRERLVEPSLALIAGYDEGDSNRQVWNNAAMLAAARLLGDDERAERCAWGTSGLVSHLSRALLADGTWYEGENYHLFAHRGLWYGVVLADAAGQGPLPPELVARFGEGFAAPFVTALPDFTFPSRRDSQYAVSLRQWRFAELAELGLARRPGDRRLHDALARLYEPGHAAGDTGRWRSTAEAERNEPPVALSRAALGWRSLLFARAELPTLRRAAPTSVLLGAQGLAVLRRDAGCTYAALDYGVSGGGHGHPDRLNLLLSVGDRRWLDDPGTGSYVDPSLHWYRSTLAHAAPLVNDRSQPRADGTLRAYEDRGGAGWADAEVEFDDPAVTLRRTIVVMPDYLIDELRWTARASVTVALPLHAPGELADVAGWAPADAPFERAEYLRDVEQARGVSSVARLVADGAAVAWVEGGGGEWWRADAPGAPGRPEHRIHVVRRCGREGALRAVWSWQGAVADVAFTDAAVEVHLADGARHVHARAPHGWHVDLRAGGARSSIDLGGLREAGPRRGRDERARAKAAPTPTRERPFVVELGEAHYRRSEPTWAEAGSPTARVRIDAHGPQLGVTVVVRKRDPAFVPPGTVNGMDNERPEVNGDGVQLHVGLRDASAATPLLLGWLLVPGHPGPSIHPLDERASRARLIGGADVGADGYTVSWVLELESLRQIAPGATEVGVDVLVNDGAPGRERRRGQLVMSGARGEFVYLRGDRHDPERLLWFRLPDA